MTLDSAYSMFFIIGAISFFVAQEDDALKTAWIMGMALAANLGISLLIWIAHRETFPSLDGIMFALFLSVGATVSGMIAGFGLGWALRPWIKKWRQRIKGNPRYP